MLSLIMLAVLGASDPQTGDAILFSGMTGCTNTAINVATQCELRVARGLPSRNLTPYQYHSMAVYVYYARGGGTGYTFDIDTCIEGLEDTDCTDATDWFNVQSQTATGPYTDLDTKQYRKSANADDYSVFFVGILYPRVRIHTILCTGGGCNANDKITIKAIAHTDSLGVFP